MTKSATINTRIEPRLKAEAEVVLSMLGISTSDAITMFFKQVVLNKGLPFPLRIPNADTVAAFAEDRSDLQKYTSVKEMMDDILAEEDQ